MLGASLPPPVATAARAGPAAAPAAAWTRSGSGLTGQRPAQRAENSRRRLAAAAAAAPTTSTAATATAAGEGRSVAVIGAGVVGLTSALRIQRLLPGAAVTVVAEQWADTTSHGAAGLWKPYTLGDTPPELANRWGEETLGHYLRLYQSAEAPAAGTVLTSAYQLFRRPPPDPAWAAVVPHFRHLTARELAAYDPEGVHTHGWSYRTVITEGRLYLAWLAAQLEAAGGRREVRRIEGVGELSGHDVVVNCAGLGAAKLIGDAGLYPVRGHVLRVRAPWVRHYVNAEHPEEGQDCYIIPNSDTVVLGGTLGKGDWDTTPRAADRAAILERACAVVPSLRAAEFVSEWVGLRPGRASVRLELELLELQQAQQAKQAKRRLPVVHNYGHGGAGLTLAWGCAGDAAALVQQALLGEHAAAAVH